MVNNYLITCTVTQPELSLVVKNNILVLVPVDDFLTGDMDGGIWEVDMDNNHARGPGGIHHLYNKKYDVYVDDRHGQGVLVKRVNIGREEPLLAFEFIEFADEHGGAAYWHIGTTDTDTFYMNKKGISSVGFAKGTREQSVWLLTPYQA
ncbi:hypothetical protein ACEV60_08655 [Enterobacter ludwigii]|uniref:hypothetical protein n=1 Tax=Enterobacter ludwigii TaxID=299767 RepID=UPI00242ADF4F|nr:hypothetical protein [Enterobacter ludwigii]WGA07187.1 hypothetical protein NFK84_24510 [Enterobacter ludwigii]